MLFNTDNLNTDYNTRNTLNLLESMYRIDRVWSKQTPASVPLMESKEYGAFIARYSDLMKLSEEYDASIQECLDAVIYENHLRPNEVIVSLEEWRPYVDPLILHRFSNNYVLVPEINTPAYRLCEVCMESFLETGDYTWLDFYVECPRSILNEAITKADRVTVMNALRKKFPDLSVEELNKKADALLRLSGKGNETTMQAFQNRDKNIKEIDAKNHALQTAIAAEKKEHERKVNSSTLVKGTGTTASKDLGFNSGGNTAADSSAEQNEKKDDSPSWFAQKWTALKNWWNNAGQADSNGNVGFFSNLVGKFKNLIGWGNNNQNNNTTNTNQVNNQSAQPAEKAQDQTNKAAEEAAKKAEAEKKQAEEAAKQQANKAAEQAKNDQKQEENKTAPAKPTDNKTAAPAATT